MTRRGTGVLDAPGRGYGSGSRETGTSGPRRAAGSVRRDLQEEFGRDFDGDFGEPGGDGFDGSGAGRWEGGARRGFWGWVPATLWGRIGAGFGVAAVLGLGVAGAMGVRSAMLRDERFVIPTSAAIAIEGNEHVTKAQLLSILGEDVERNIFTVPLMERRAELERLPWVEHATVMRLLPNRLRVSVVERVPVAFVRQGGRIGLVDKNGVLMDMGSGAGFASGSGERYSFPVVTGISAEEPVSTRVARMKIFARFMQELDAGGERVSEKLSEVDLGSPEDVRALIPDEAGTGGSLLLVHFGDSDFLERYRLYRTHLGEWRAQYPRLSSVDMRYETQAVLKMEGESGAAAVGKAPVPAKAVEEKVGVPVSDAAKASVQVVKVGATAASAKNVAGARGEVGSETPHDRPSSFGDKEAAGLSQSSPSGGSTVAAKADSNAGNGTVHHLMVARDVPAKKVAVKKPATHGAAGKSPVGTYQPAPVAVRP